MKIIVLILAAVMAQTATAKTKVDVPVFANKTVAHSCSAVEPWKKDIDVAFQYQLINSLKETGQFEILQPELLRREKRAALFDSGVSTIHKKSSFRVTHYSILGALKTFNLCDGQAVVEVEIKVVDAKTGQVTQTFVSRGVAPNKSPDRSYMGATFNTGVFRDSPIGRATVAAIGDATDRLKKAFPNNEVASSDLRVKTIRRGRR